MVLVSATAGVPSIANWMLYLHLVVLALPTNCMAAPVVLASTKWAVPWFLFQPHIGYFMFLDSATDWLIIFLASTIVWLVMVLLKLQIGQSCFLLKLQIV